MYICIWLNHGIRFRSGFRELRCLYVALPPPTYAILVNINGWMHTKYTSNIYISKIKKEVGINYYIKSEETSQTSCIAIHELTRVI